MLVDSPQGKKAAVLIDYPTARVERFELPVGEQEDRNSVLTNTDAAISIKALGLGQAESLTLSIVTYPDGSEEPTTINYSTEISFTG